MRPILALMAILFATGGSAADGWREYVYPGLKFAVGFREPSFPRTPIRSREIRSAFNIPFP